MVRIDNGVWRTGDCHMFVVIKIFFSVCYDFRRWLLLEAPSRQIYL